MEFLTWLADRNLDIQSIEPDMLDALRRQFDQYCQRQAPVAEVLVSPADCQWPRRSYRVATVIANAADVGLVVTRASDMQT